MSRKDQITKEAAEVVKSGLHLPEFLRGLVGRHLSQAPLLERVPSIAASAEFVESPNPAWSSDPIHVQISEAKIRLENRNAKTLTTYNTTCAALSDVEERIKATKTTWTVIGAVLCFLLTTIIVIAEGYQFGLPYLNWVGVDIQNLSAEWGQSWLHVTSGFLFAGVVATGMFFVAHAIIKSLPDWRKKFARILVLSVLLIGVVTGISYMRHGLSSDAQSWENDIIVAASGANGASSGTPEVSDAGGVPTVIFILISLIGLYAAAISANFGMRMVFETNTRRLQRLSLLERKYSLEAKKQELSAISGVSDAALLANLQGKLERMRVTSECFLKDLKSDIEHGRFAFTEYARRTGQNGLI